MKHKLLLSFLFFSILSYTQVRLVYDVNPGTSGSNPSQLKLIPANIINNSLLEGLIFSANNGTSGLEPHFIHDNQKMLVSDINPGTGGSNPEGFTFYKNEFYYTANNPNSGKEIWKGVTSSTLFKDIRTGTTNSTPLNYHTFNGNLYFTAFTDAKGRELWKSDGTNAGTNLLKDINTDANNNNNTDSSNPESFVELNGQLFFVARSTVTASKGIELYVTDGTANGTSLVKDINANGDSSPLFLTVFNNKLYFSATNGANGRELWVSDGTNAGTTLIDINTGASNSSPRGFVVFNNKLYFVATHGSLGEELFSIDANGNFGIVKDINNGSQDASPNNLFVYNNKLYFSANNGIDGIELWVSEGTTATTNLLKDINPSGNSNPIEFTEYNNKLYFNADDGTNGKELWVTDGTASGTEIVEDINTSGDSNPQELIVVNNDLFFTADNGTSGTEIFKFYDVALSLGKNEFLNINIYPNPTSDFFNIETNEEIKTVILYDLQGKVIKKFKKSINNKYSITGIKFGHYFIKVILANTSVIKKIILNH